MKKIVVGVNDMGSVYAQKFSEVWIRLLKGGKNKTIREVTDYCQENGINFTASDGEYKEWWQIERSVITTLLYHMQNGVIMEDKLDELDSFVLAIYFLWKSDSRISDYFNTNSSVMVKQVQKYLKDNPIKPYFMFLTDDRTLDSTINWSWEELYTPIIHLVNFKLNTNYDRTITHLKGYE